MLRPLVIATALLFTGSVYADEIVIHRDAPDVVVPPTTTTTTVEKHGGGCDSSSVHTENDLGDSKTVTHSNCD